MSRGEVGEVVYRGPTVMQGYFGQEEETAAAFAGGWFHSGDLVREDEEGFLYVVDWLKDMLISGGENVYPAEVERTLIAHPAVAEVAVVGIPHLRWVETCSLPCYALMRNSGAITGWRGPRRSGPGSAACRRSSARGLPLCAAGRSGPRGGRGSESGPP